MKYTAQTKTALNRLDLSLKHLYQLIKLGKQAEAMQFMEQGDLKDKFEELRNIVTLSATSNIGAAGTSPIGNL